jgi:hypothetical protein
MTYAQLEVIADAAVRAALYEMGVDPTSDLPSVRKAVMFAGEPFVTALQQGTGGAQWQA